MKYFAIGAAFLAILWAWLREGDFIHFIGLVLVVWVLGPMFLLAGIASVVAKVKSHWPRWLGTAWRIIGMGFAAVVLSAVLGRAFNEYRVRETRDYVARAIVQLDRIHARTGCFPTTLPSGK